MVLHRAATLHRGRRQHSALFSPRETINLNRPLNPRNMFVCGQGAEIFSATYGQGGTTDDELLLLGQLYFDPRAPASARLVKQIPSSSDQALKSELPRGLSRG